MEIVNLKRLKTGTGINVEMGGMGAITEENKDVSILEQKIAVIKGEVPRQYIKDDAIYYIVDDDNSLKKLIIRGQSIDVSAGGGGGDNYYILPDTGIPQTDLSQEVQDSLGRADTAIQGLSIGLTTTGNPGTNAEVTNSGTQTNPILNFTIPRGNPGETSYLHIMYSQDNPSSDAEIHGTFTTGDEYIGICSNNTQTAPGTYTSYSWMRFVGTDYILTNQDKIDIATIVEGSIIIPTKLSDLTDDLGTSPVHTHSQYATTTYVDGLVGNINTILTSIVGS